MVDQLDPFAGEPVTVVFAHVRAARFGASDGDAVQIVGPGALGRLGLDQHRLSRIAAAENLGANVHAPLRSPTSACVSIRGLRNGALAV